MEWKHCISIWKKEKEKDEDARFIKQKYCSLQKQKRCMREKVYLNDNISRTGLATGISMKRELVKNSSLRLASRFLGIFEAESLIVNNENNLLTRAFCISFKISQSHQESENTCFFTKDNWKQIFPNIPTQHLWATSTLQKDDPQPLLLTMPSRFRSSH